MPQELSVKLRDWKPGVVTCQGPAVVNPSVLAGLLSQITEHVIAENPHVIVINMAVSVSVTHAIGEVTIPSPEPS